MAKPALPTSQHDLVRGSKIDKNWYQFFQRLADAFATPAEVGTQVTTAIAAIPPPEVSIRGSETVEVLGNSKDGFFINARRAGFITEAITDGDTQNAPSGNAVFDALALKADKAITIATTAPLTGGGDLSANRTLAISAATTVAPGSMSAADKAKLDGVAAGATANSTDAQLRDRATHTGTQLAATVSDFTAAADARIAAASIDALADVTITAPAAGQTLVRNAGNTAWVNGAASGGGGANLPAVMARISLGF